MAPSCEGEADVVNADCTTRETRAGAEAQAQTVHKPVGSSLVDFYPSRWQGKFWRIGHKFYDLTPFLDQHPGGRQLLEMARDRFNDSTFAFEAHHHNQPLVRAMLAKYEVRDVVPEHPAKETERFPSLTDNKTFFSVLRRNVRAHLREVGGPGPTQACLNLFWAALTAWFMLEGLFLSQGHWGWMLLHGLCSGLLGGFGHNWVHQPKYRTHAYVLDLIGFSSEGWYREHLLQHHMYTNSPLDNHYLGTEPMLVVSSTRDKGFVHRWTPHWLYSMILTLCIALGTHVNYLAHLVLVFKGEENVSVGKLFFPVLFCLAYYCWGWSGVAMQGLSASLVSIWYFTLALMNHNTTNCWDVPTKNAAVDWGHAQLTSSGDIAVGSTFYSSVKYLWLNFHTVHHLFPHTDMSKHPGIQRVLLETLKDFPEIKYECGEFWPMYSQMITSFKTAVHLGEEINLYPGNAGGHYR